MTIKKEKKPMSRLPLPSSSRRVVVQQFADDPMEAIHEKMTLEDFPPPDPSMLAPEDIVIAIRSAAVGWVDLLMACGLYQHVPQPPYTPGLEYSGEVIWIGAAVDPAALAVGDRVMVDGLFAGPRSSGRYRGYGGFATWALASKETLIKIPEAFSYEQACNFLGSYETAYYCLVTCGELQAGETVLVHGATGATGLAAVHLAKRLGARVIATGRSAEKLAFVKAQGADEVLLLERDSQGKLAPFRETIKALTGGKGADVVYDGVGGDISVESLRCLRFGGRFLIVGWAATPFVANTKGQRGAPNANQLPTNLILMKGLRVLGCPTVIGTQHDPSVRQKRLADLFRWVAEEELRPYIDQVFPLERYKEALRAKWEGKIIGGCALSL
jgi:NADPH2:quinone reductase